jgi:hypothetical protein
MFRGLGRGVKLVALVAGSLAFIVAGPAFASHIAVPDLTPTPFTVNPSAVGEPEGPFTATFIDFSYRALVDQSTPAPPGSFTETGGGFFSSFQHPTLGTPVNNTGINQDYRLYVTFSATGTAAPNNIGGIDVTFTSFAGTLFVDPNLDTTLTCAGPGACAGPGDGNQDITVASGGADDIAVALGSPLFVGGAHVFPGLANGDFAVIVFFEPIGGFFSGPVFVGLTLADINGVNTTINFAGQNPLNPFVDLRIDGSGNLFVARVVPNPSTLVLLGLGLAGISALPALRRRRPRP